MEKIAERIQTQLADAAKQKGPGVDIDKIKADLAKQYAGETEKATKRSEALRAQLYKVLVQNAARQEIASQKGDAELLMPFVEKAVTVSEDDGDFKVHVVDKAGDVRYSGVTGTQMTLKELVGEMKNDDRYGRLFESEAPDGGGTPPAGPRRPVGAESTPLTSVEKIKRGLSQQGNFQRGSR